MSLKFSFADKFLSSENFFTMSYLESYNEVSTSKVYCYTSIAGFELFSVKTIWEIILYELETECETEWDTEWEPS